MLYKKIRLKDYYPNLDDYATLEIIVPVPMDNISKPLDLMLIAPGGGYAYCSKREADPIAAKFLALGYAIATLIYTTRNPNDKEMIYPKPQLELLASIDYLKNNAKEFLIDENRISVVGFSAGGHLVASIGYLYKKEEFLKVVNATNNLKPFSLVLCYPVVTSIKEKAHVGSFVNLMNYESSLIKEVNVDENITNDYPPTYIWTTEDDNAVPSVNTKLLIEAFKTNNVKYESIIYPHGPHGLATADIITNIKENCNEEIAKWANNADKFIKSL